MQVAFKKDAASSGNDDLKSPSSSSSTIFDDPVGTPIDKSNSSHTGLDKVQSTVQRFFNRAMEAYRYMRSDSSKTPLEGAGEGALAEDDTSSNTAPNDTKQQYSLPSIWNFHKVFSSILSTETSLESSKTNENHGNLAEGEGATEVSGVTPEFKAFGCKRTCNRKLPFLNSNEIGQFWFGKRQTEANKTVETKKKIENLVGISLAVIASHYCFHYIVGCNTRKPNVKETVQYLTSLKNLTFVDV